MEQNLISEWVSKRLAVARPEWSPDVERARARLSMRAAEPRIARAWATAAVTAAVTIGIFLAAPQGRVVAQELWYRWFIRNFDVVRLDLSRIPLKSSITTNGNQTVVATLDEAEHRAGYRPIVPSPGVVANTPAQVMVTGPIGVQQAVNVQELRDALVKAGAGDVQVPAEWQGITLRMNIAPMVILQYPDDVQIVQSTPIEFQIPGGFPVAKFAEAVFRCGGVSAWEARAMGEKFAKNPAWLLDIPEDEIVTVQEVQLGGVTGMLVDEPAEAGGSRVTVLFGTSDRIFAVVSNSRQRSLEVAKSLL